MIFTPLYPTTIAESEVALDAPTKDECIKAVMGYLLHNGFSNESTSDVSLHTNTQLKSIYTGVSGELNKYLAHLGVDCTGIDINITKSWLNIVEAQHTPMHCHGEAHFSFAYYLNVPDHYTQFLEFQHEGAHPSEPFRGFFKNLCDDWSTTNCLSYAVVPKEGSLCIFPADLLHRTGGDGVDGSYLEEPVDSLRKLKQKRICIAGDVVITHKDVSPSYAGLQPTRAWRTFTTTAASVMA